METSIIKDTLHFEEAAHEGKETLFTRFLAKAIPVVLSIAVFFMPLWFLPTSLDILEMNKQTLLVILVMLGLLAWLGRAIILKRFMLSRSWLHLVVLVLTGGYLISSLLSVDRYVSLVGNFGQMQWAFLSMISFALFYFILVNHVKTSERLYQFLLVFLCGTAITGIVGFFQMIKLFPLKYLTDAGSNVAFNTIGTINSFVIFMTIPMIVSIGLFALRCRDEQTWFGQSNGKGIFSWLVVWINIVFGFASVLVADFWPAWLTLMFGSALFVAFAMLRNRHKSTWKSMVLPMAVFVLSVVFWASPALFKALNLPGEVSPSLSHTWLVAKQTLQAHALFGSGPGTWIYDYSQYRSPSVNYTQLWATRFERGISSFFTLLAMVGVIGAALWIILLISGLVKGVKQIFTESNDDLWKATVLVVVSWASVAFISFFYNYNLAHHFAFWFFMALVGALVANGSFYWSRERKPMLTTWLSMIFLIVAACAFATLWLSVQRLVADAKYSAAIQSFRDGKPIATSMGALSDSIALNKLNDVYYRNISQAYLIRASQVMQGSDADKSRQLNQLLTSAIDAAKQATVLAPANVDNWSNLAIIHQAITSFTPGADEAAIAAYQEALKREPNNPVFYNEIGKLYILRADAYGRLLASPDEAKRKEAEQNVKAELDKAFASLNQAIQVKGDFAPARYHMGILYERQGRMKDAVGTLEQILRENQQDVGVAFQLAILYYRNNQKAMAQDMLQKILKFDPSYANARWYLASLLEEQGHYEEALAQLQPLKQAFPGNTAILDKIAQVTREKAEKAKPKAQAIPEPLKQDVTGPKPASEVK